MKHPNNVSLPFLQAMLLPAVAALAGLPISVMVASFFVPYPQIWEWEYQLGGSACVLPAGAPEINPWLDLHVEET